MSKTDVFDRKVLKMVWDISGAQKKEAHMRSELMNVKSKLLNICDHIQDSVATKYTGYYVMLKKKEDGWECLGIFNPDKDDESKDRECDLIVPIPDPLTVPEFDGW